MTAVICILIFILNTFAIIIDILLFPIYYLCQQPWLVRKRSEKQKGTVTTEPNGNLRIKTLSKIHALHKEIVDTHLQTIADVMNFFSKKYANLKCLGTREYLSEHGENQCTSKLKLGSYIWKTYAQVNVLACNFGKGIRELGHKPRTNIAIFAETRAEWMIAAQGLFKQSIPIATIYATLGDEGIIHATNEVKVTTIITSFDLIPKLNHILPKIPLVNTLIYMEHPVKELDLDEFGCKGHRIVKFSDVLKLGALSTIKDTLPCPNETAIIMYTSGSTGIPKGVILSHYNLLGTIKAFADCIPSMGIKLNDYLIGFLPLAHVFELIVEQTALCIGVAIGYSSPQTAFDTSLKIFPGTKGDATVLKPNIMAAVPLILDRICAGIKDKVSKSSAIKQAIFKFSYKYKTYWHNKGYSTPIINYLVFKKMAAILGGKVKVIMSGGAPLTIETQNFIQTCLCLRIIPGYGLTETTSCVSVSDGNDRSLGRVGPPTTAAQIMLESWKEGNYSVDDKPHPRGEIIVGGEVVSYGYYKLEEQTKQDFFDYDGLHWFKTGDIGEVYEDGVLAIIDRKKDLVKLAHGEYICLGKIEALLKTCSPVDNICIVANSTKTYTFGLVSPNQKALEELAKQMHISTGDFKELCKDQKLSEAVVNILAEHGKLYKLNRIEIPKKIKLCETPWTPESSLVTSAFKIRRKMIENFYKKDLEELYV